MPWNIKMIYLIPFFVLSMFACEDNADDTVVLTEDVLFLSGERSRLSGRIYSLSGEASDHGFEIDTDEAFGNPEIIQLGAKASLGSFIAESSQLTPETEYFYRAYAVSNGIEYYGKTKSFGTLEVLATSFSPKQAYSGDKLTILGANFTSDVEVFFNDVEAEISNIDFEAIIDLTVPQIDDETEVSIIIRDKLTEIVFDESFNYIFGEWTELNKFPMSRKFSNNFFFTHQGHFITGLGQDENNHTWNFDIWQFEIDTEIWKKLPYGGSPTLGAFFNDGGYFGGGLIDPESVTFADQFWKYDNELFTFLGTVPFNLQRAVSFVQDNRVFIVGGFEQDNSPNYRIYEYSELTSVWKGVAGVPISISQDDIHFSYGQLEYFMTADDEIWTFDGFSDSWNLLGEAQIDIRTGGINVVIDDKAYIGLFGGGRRIWEYDITNNSWKEKTFLENGFSSRNAGAFVKGSKLRAIRIATEADEMSIWEFDPNSF